MSTETPLNARQLAMALAVRQQLAEADVEAYDQMSEEALMVEMGRAVLADAERAHRWIPVSEKLPEQADQVQVYSPSRGVEAAYYRPLEQIWVTVETYGIDSEARQIYDASHWKPLDEPPTEAADLLAGMRR